MLLGSVAEAIGRTPLVRLDRFARARGLPSGGLLAKLENANPGLSKKDRVARRIILEAKRDGRLRNGQAVVELTSGNTGTGLAIACAATDHPFTAVMSKGNSPERARMMRALGATVVLVDQAPGGRPGFVSGADLELVQSKTKETVESLGAFRADQFQLEANENAHYYETGPEIWHAAKPRAFVDFAGTGGSFAGVARFLKERDPTIWCGWIEPARASHQIQGGGYFTSPDGSPLVFQKRARDRGHIDGVLRVSDEEAISAARDLAKLEGIFGGFSAGANLHAACQVLARHRDAKDFSVVFLVCDSGMKYLSTPLYG